jgi:aldehyde dehydrogenase (NAD+)
LIRQGAETMKRTFLELGGKSALIVTEDVDLSKIMGSAVGVCVHAGQACALTTRMLVHRSLFAGAVDSVTAAFGMVPVGDPALPQTLVGPVISARQRERVLDACERARRDGAEIAIGGGAFDDLPAELAGGFTSSRRSWSGSTTPRPSRRRIFGPVWDAPVR